MSNAHSWSPWIGSQSKMGLSYHVTSHHFISHHILSHHITSLHIPSHCITSHHITSFTQHVFVEHLAHARHYSRHWGHSKEKTRVKSLPEAYILVEKRENKQDKYIFKTVIISTKKKIKQGKELLSACVWGSTGEQVFKTGSGGSKLCGPLAEECCRGEQPARGESSAMSWGRLEGCCEAPDCGGGASLRAATAVVVVVGSGALGTP